MKLLLPIVALAGFATLPLWPAEWRLALGLGWGIALAVETVLARKRMAAREKAGNSSLQMVIVFGFLGRLALITLGAIVGAEAGLFPHGPYLGAFLGGIFVGEALTLPGLMKTTGVARASSDADSRKIDS